MAEFMTEVIVAILEKKVTNNKFFIHEIIKVELFISNNFFLKQLNQKNIF